MKTITVSKSESDVRVDVFVASKYPGFTRSSLSALFDKELVKVNGKIASASTKIKPGYKVQIEDKLLKTQPEVIDLPVIYEDDDIIVINKPAGLLTHSKGALNLEPTIASFLQSKLNDKMLTGNRAGIVHRLDRGTSGVIITAKNAESLKWLQKQFSTRKVIKKYLAVVEGAIKPEEAIIDAPIARNPKKPQTFTVAVAGKPAQTKYQVIKEFTKNRKLYSLVELSPKTGRTHQIRVHLKYIKHPIVGDHVYGSDDGKLMLHALSLELTLKNGERKIFSVDPPDEFSSFIPK